MCLRQFRVLSLFWCKCFKTISNPFFVLVQVCVRQSVRCSAVIVRKSPEGSSSTQYLPDKLTYLPFSGRCYMIFEKYFMIFHTYFMIFEKCPQVYFFTISVFIVWGPSSINRLVPSALFTILSNKVLPLEKLTYHHFEEERKKYFRRRTRLLKAYWSV